jgi:hypothetical protein
VEAKEPGASGTSATTKTVVAFDGQRLINNLILVLLVVSSLAASVLYATAQKIERERHHLSLALNRKLCEDHFAGVEPMLESPPPPSPPPNDRSKWSFLYDPSLPNPPERMDRAERWLAANAKYVKCLDGAAVPANSVLDNVALAFREVPAHEANH